ncbi:hypothetical protein GUJ93_ZPchr0013g35465 [Zizania palustris]|uniref:Beta-hexosaminidase n=1 Tax=Zizania palustris TaxID=103762 RepID=A0A8J5WSJ6_ZIZPA|nr:hypothetical protein GUJ93_ZPchr0013g35465 [Zizania palustris]
MATTSRKQNLWGKSKPLLTPSPPEPPKFLILAAMAALPYLLPFLVLLWPAAAPAADSLAPPSQPPPSPPPQRLQVWPKPTSVSWQSAVYAPLSPSFSIRAVPSHPSLRDAIAFYTSLIRTERHAPLVPPTNYTLSRVPIRLLSVSVSGPDVPLGPAVDESYTLSVLPDSGSADVSAATPWGAIRGLETFSQLAWAGGGAASGGQPIVPCGIEISDRPHFTHRGILLDTARNYYPVHDILHTLRAMAFNKLNVFHWHITDSQSFPIVLPTVPNLANSGSYSPAMRYTENDVRRIVRFAATFGIRVIPEIDMPGHTGSWAGAFPEIVTCANMFWAPQAKPALAAEPGTGQLNPLNPKTYRVAQDVLRDLVALFPDPYLHGGADEELNRTVIYWEDVLLGPKVAVGPAALPKETTVLQTWNNGPENTKRIVAAGYRAIVSSASYYYLDCGHGGWVGNDSRYDKQDKEQEGTPLFNDPGGTGGSWCAPFKTWQRIYDYDILHGLTDDEARLVLGGEVALWSEQSDETVLDARLWPRAAAAAETLWSGNKDSSGKKRYANATDRLNDWRHRMVQRGIRAEPIQPLWCSFHPGMCNLSQ